MMGRAGQSAVARMTGMSRNTIIAGAKELTEGVQRSERVRRPGWWS